MSASRKRLSVCLGAAALLAALLAPAGAQASFGIQSESLSALASNEDESPDTQAGSHPYEYTVSFAMNQNGAEEPEGILHDVFVELPPGLVGNPQALPRCKREDFDTGAEPACPGNTQVGVAEIEFGIGAPAHTGVYNLTPSPGSPATLGLSVNNISTLQDASLRSGSDFGVSVGAVAIPSNVEVQEVSEHIWGLPMASSHDERRLCVNPLSPNSVFEDCPSDAKPTPFLTLPTSCGAPLQTTLRVHSVEGATDSQTVATPVGLDGCNALQFEPTISSQPTTDLADSPSGLDFNLHQRQDEEPEDLATSSLKDAKVTLPEGLTLNPSAANGLAACSEAQIGYQPSGGKIHFSESPQSCPDAAKLGSLEVDSRLLDHKLGGAVYLAKPYDNPFGSLLAIYLAIEDKRSGIVAKLAGKVSPDPTTGRLTTTFEESPQLPIEDIDLHFFNGARAALKTPLDCGTHTTTSTLTPWSTPEGQDAHPSDSFQISQAAGGSGPCPSSEAQAPNKPSFTAGTTAPAAGAYSPFVLKLTRPGGSQQLTGIDTVLPPGLTGRLAGIATCSEAQLAVAKSREAPDKGALEQQSPACPASSEVGTVTVGAGAGPAPFYATGHVYLAGPYKGAPLSLAVITPALAGPFDLGDVVVRAALYLEPETARIHAVSDPIPTILDGIPLNVRSIALNLGRPQFTLNPTSCDPMSITGTASTLPGQSAALSSPFQVGGCGALGYRPRLSLRLTGSTKRGRFPALKATVTAKPGEANTARLSVTLPHSEFLEQGHFGTICTRVQFAAKACPEKSVYGSAKVTTPLLEYPLEGPVYLRSSDHNLPDLVLALKGLPSQPIEITLDGRIDSKHRGIRTTFEGVPDAPFTTAILTMPGAKKGLLVNSTNVCASINRATVQMDAQNGKAHDFSPALVNPKCKQGARKKKGGRR